MTIVLSFVSMIVLCMEEGTCMEDQIAVAIVGRMEEPGKLGCCFICTLVSTVSLSDKSARVWRSVRYRGGESMG